MLVSDSLLSFREISWNKFRFCRAFKESKCFEVIEDLWDLCFEKNSFSIFRFVIDEDVMVNYYRAMGAGILREAAEIGDRGDIVNARDTIARGSEKVKNSPVALHPTVVKIIQDLDSAIPRFQNQAVYERVGKADLKSKANSHYNKRGNYKNVMQKKLLVEAEEEI